MNRPCVVCRIDLGPYDANAKGELANFTWTCPGCGGDRDPGSRFFNGPDPLRQAGPILWDPACLAHFRFAHLSDHGGGALTSPA